MICESCHNNMIEEIHIAFDFGIKYQEISYNCGKCGSRKISGEQESKNMDSFNLSRFNGKMFNFFKKKVSREE